MTNFSGYPSITDSVRHAGEMLETLRFRIMPKVYFKPEAMFEIAGDF